MSLLKFQRAKKNNKLFANKYVETLYTFSLPSGFSCPGALACLSKADRETGKIKDGSAVEFRCYSASQEALYPNVRKGRWDNFDLLRQSNDMADLIQQSLPKKARHVRLHVSGDFFSQEYFDAWLAVAKANPHMVFYTYTKSLLYWLARKKEMPKNFVLTASYGGRYDSLIGSHKLRHSRVVFSKGQARAAGLKIDHDDNLAINPKTKRFALLLHGIQPAKTAAAKAMSKLRNSGNSGYGEARRLSLELVA